MAEAGKREVEITVGGKPVPADKAARIREALKATLKRELEREAVGGGGGDAAGDVSSHARW